MSGRHPMGSGGRYGRIEADDAARIDACAGGAVLDRRLRASVMVAAAAERFDL